MRGAPWLVGSRTACTINAIRPEVCRTCMPGDAECAMARRKFGLKVLTVFLRKQGPYRVIY